MQVILLPEDVHRHINYLENLQNLIKRYLISLIRIIMLLWTISNEKNCS